MSQGAKDDVQHPIQLGRQIPREKPEHVVTVFLK